MKKGRLFAKIVYYIFTFVLGAMIALGLPTILYSSNIDAFLAKSLNNGDYLSAIQPLAPYYNEKYVADVKIDGGGEVVLFETVMEDGAKGDTEGQRYKSYLGFLFGIVDIYDTFSTANNQTKLVVTTLSGEQVTVELLNTNQDGDEKDTNDLVWSVVTNGYLRFDLPQTTIQSVASLAFYDKDGNILGGKQIDLTNCGLDFSSQFFADADLLIDEYNVKLEEWKAINRNPNATDDQINKIASEISELNASLHQEFLAKSNSYNTFDIPKDLKSIVTTKEVLIIVGYFVVVYLIGDFLLGNHYIIRFFRWIKYKVFKIQPKNKKAIPKNEVFGHDYFSSVTLSLDLEEVPDFNGSVQVKYTNSDKEIVFILLKENGYCATQRIKAGTYVNPFMDIDRAYAPVDLPENLEVEGYKMDVKIKIIKREV